MPEESSGRTPASESAISRFYSRVHDEWWPIPSEAGYQAPDRVLKLHRLILRHRPARVLEVGFGDPRQVLLLTSELKESTFHVVELDESRVSLAKDLGLSASIVDITSKPLPFGDGEFDAIVMAEVLEHLYDTDAALGEIHRILRPGGRLFVSTPNLASWYNRVLLLLGIQPVSTEISTVRVFGRRLRRLGQGNRPVGHIRLFTRSALIEFMDFHGFGVETFLGYSHPDAPIDSIFSHFPSLASGFVASFHRQNLVRHAAESE
jgi:SAM-dependent methyltransferase